MHNRTDGTIEALNHLVIIAGDGAAGYQELAEYAENPLLKASFARYATERREFADELKSLVLQAGGEPESGTGPVGALHRVWIDIKTSFTSKNDSSLLEDGIRGDQAARSAYQTALAEGGFGEDLRLVLTRHLKLIEDALFDLQQHSSN